MRVLIAAFVPDTKPCNLNTLPIPSMSHITQVVSYDTILRYMALTAREAFKITQSFQLAPRLL
jgi:hypothetical protein